MKQRPDLQHFLNAHRRFAGRVPGVQSTNPLVRILSWMAMFVVLGVSMAVGLVLLALLMVGGLGLAVFIKVRSLFGKRSQSTHSSQPGPQGRARSEPTSNTTREIIEGDFEVVRRRPSD